MLELWSPAKRHGLWRQLWLALAEAEQELGVPIPDEAIAQMRAHLDDIDFDVVAAYERRFRHDVMAHVHAFGDVAPAARGFIHYGATSAYVTDNADLILMRRGMELLRGKIIHVLGALAAFAREWRAEADAWVDASAARAADDRRQARHAVDAGSRARPRRPRSPHRRRFRCRGVKGTTGTQASFLEIFDGDHAKVRELDARVHAEDGLRHVDPRVGADVLAQARRPGAWASSPASRRAR